MLGWLLVACEPTPPVDTDVVEGPVVDTDDVETDPRDTSDVVDTDVPIRADLVFPGTRRPPPLLGVGAQIWPGDPAWPAALDPLGAGLVRIPFNPNFGDARVRLPVDASRATWDAWLAEHALDVAPTFRDDLASSLALTEARGLDWIGLVWEAPPAWETADGALRADHVDDYAALIGALVGWLDDAGITPRWLELANEPDGDWNTYIGPEAYDALVIATRAELDARGLDGIGILGPGLAVLGGWTTPHPWVPSLSDAAVDALEGWSVHAWDDYAEAGEGHLFLEDRWDIFAGQVEARDPTKPVFVTELGSKDTVFGDARYNVADPGVCGVLSESDGYAIRMLAHLAVALAAGADGIVVWEAADQSWSCANYGMIDESRRPRRFLDAMAMFTSAWPSDGGVVLPTGADLPAVGVLGAEQGALLLVNDTDTRVIRTVQVTGDWRFVEARGFATETRLLRDELFDLGQADAPASVAIDSNNVSYFDGDPDRAFRAAEGDAGLVWTPGGDVTAARIVAWSWNGAAPVSVRVDGSADGTTWAPVASTETVTRPGWNRHELVVSAFAAGTRSVRITLPAGEPAWNPQLGDVSLTWRLDAPAALPAGEAPWTVDLPPGSAVVIRVGR